MSASALPALYCTAPRLNSLQDHISRTHNHKPHQPGRPLSRLAASELLSQTLMVGKTGFILAASLYGECKCLLES